MRKINILTTVALLLSAWSATAAIPPATEAQRTVSRICRQDPLNNSLTGVFALRMDGDTVAAVNIRQKLVPASNVKLLTTGLALHLLGADYRFETRLACSGEITDGVLKGDLYILGGGDPTTGARTDCAEALTTTFGRWAQLLADAGITRIEGRVLGDPRFFSETTPQNLGWTYDDLGTNYGAGPLGLNFFENAQNFYVTPGPSVGSAPSVRPRYPDTPWMRYSVSATTGAARSSNTLYYVNTGFGPFGEVAGSFPVDRRGYTLECSNLFGAYTCAYYFCNYLKEKGISVEGGYGDVTTRGEIRTDLVFGGARDRAPGWEELRVLGSARSVALAEIVRDTNYESDNFYAETLLRMISRQSGRGTGPDDCSDAALEAFRALGLRTDGACQQFDGSGLSRKNYVSPEFFVRFLKRMTTLPAWDAYFASLPVPGAKGTLENRFPDAEQEFKDRIHMKTGSMNGVRCLSGYILAADGDPAHTIVFSLLVNNCTAPGRVATDAIDAIILAIAAENGN